MFDPFTITVVFIFLAAFVGAIIRRGKRDKCLKDFSKFMVTLEEVGGKRIWGNLRVENTGIELIYPDKYRDKDGHDESSYILYKQEFVNIQALVRFHDELSQECKKKREKELRRTYLPGPMRRLKRRVLNFFKMLRDSVVEVVNLFLNKAKAASGAGAILTSQDKYVSRMKTELIESFGTSYEPLLERYIGHKVVLNLVRGEIIVEYSGVLKEYTAEFIEIMDIDYKTGEEAVGRKADLVVSRKLGIVRHLSE